MLPKRLHRKTIYESQWINLHVDRVKMPSGKIIEEYHFIDLITDGVVALLVNSQKEICLVKVYRYQTQKVAWEVPSGRMDPGEAPQEAASRELLEETGYQAKNLKKALDYDAFNGMSNFKTHVFFGELGSNEQSEFDVDEINEVAWFSLDEIKKMIVQKEIVDASSLIPLSFYMNGLFKTQN